MPTLPRTLPLPRTIRLTGGPTLRWGVLGPGEIAAAFTSTLHRNTDQRVAAVASRSAERGDAFAAEFGVPTVHRSYEALLDDPGIDIAYIATPHPLHLPLALQAIAAGKHVLIEKPIAVRAEDARTIAAAARAAGVFAMEAMWTKFLPQSDIVRQLLADGALGALDLVSADFGAVLPDDPTSRWLDPALGGGALLDLGIYPVAFSVFAAGPAVEVIASGSLATTGVDASTALVLRSASGVRSLLHTTLRSRTPTQAMIAGSAGRIEVAAPFLMPSGVRLVDGGDAVVAEWHDRSGITGRDGLAYQAAAVAVAIAEGRTEAEWHPLDDAIAALEIVDAALDQLGATRAP